MVYYDVVTVVLSRLGTSKLAGRQKRIMQGRVEEWQNETNKGPGRVEGREDEPNGKKMCQEG